MILVGIDYSLNSPAMCIAHGKLDIKTCDFQVYAQAKKHLKVSHPQLTVLPEEDLDGVARMKRNAEFVTKRLSIFSHHIQIAMEGYSFGSKKGRHFDIAENGGVLKYLLKEQLNLEPAVIPPTVVKKFATGRGNAKKEEMYEAWLKEGGFDLLKLFDAKDADTNPVSDLVDSYFVLKTWFHQQSDIR